MPAISKTEAAERLAQGVEQAEMSHLAEIYSEIFPEQSPPSQPDASDLAQHVRSELEPDEIVDLWNIVFPADYNVWYDEEMLTIHYNEEAVGYVDNV